MRKLPLAIALTLAPTLVLAQSPSTPDLPEQVASCTTIAGTYLANWGKAQSDLILANHTITTLRTQLTTLQSKAPSK